MECNVCKRYKTLENFELRSDSGKYRRVCKKCSSIRKQIWYLENKVGLKTRAIAKKYGITRSDYDLLINEHKNLCAICVRPETSPDGRTKKVKSLSIDHNHDTGQVRGLLCWRCNAMIGYAREDLFILKSAIKYLNKYGNK